MLLDAMPLTLFLYSLGFDFRRRAASTFAGLSRFGSHNSDWMLVNIIPTV